MRSNSHPSSLFRSALPRKVTFTPLAPLRLTFHAKQLGEIEWNSLCVESRMRLGRGAGVMKVAWKIIKYTLKQKISVLHNRKEISFFKLLLLITF